MCLPAESPWQSTSQHRGILVHSNLKFRAPTTYDSQLDEADYDARMGAYQRLLPAVWAGMARWQALPLLHHVLADLRNADDLALRHAAAQVCIPSFDGFFQYSMP